MLEVRDITPDELDVFAGIDDPGPTRRRLDALLRDGLTRPEWCFVALQDGVPAARAGFFADEPIGTEPMEVALFGLALPWERDHGDIAAALLAAALETGARIGPAIDARLNTEVHDHLDERRRVLEAVGFRLFQEKEGYSWIDAGAPVERSARVTFRTAQQVGREEFAHAMGRAIEGTLDRNDRFFWELAGADEWGRIMLGFMAPDDEATWKLAFDGSGELVGHVCLSSFDEDATGTIAHIGVVPEQRGRGYVNDLMAEATADAQARGFASVLSDVDVENDPMRAAMEQAGHLPGIRPWHVWHLRFPPLPRGG
jgi:ribosomal protein S18 acetylase RimI-like enzyme